MPIRFLPLACIFKLFTVPSLSILYAPAIVLVLSIYSVDTRAGELIPYAWSEIGGQRAGELKFPWTGEAERKIVIRDRFNVILGETYGNSFWLDNFASGINHDIWLDATVGNQTETRNVSFWTRGNRLITPEVELLRASTTAAQINAIGDYPPGSVYGVFANGQLLKWHEGNKVWIESFDANASYIIHVVVITPNGNSAKSVPFMYNPANGNISELSMDMAMNGQSNGDSNNGEVGSGTGNESDEVADGGDTTDGDTTDGDTTDGDTTDGDTTDGDTTDGDTTDGDTTDGDTTDGDTTDGDTTDGDTTDGNTTDGNTTEGDTTEGDTTDGVTADGDTADGDTTDGDTTDGDTTDGDTADGDTSEGGGDTGGDSNSDIDANITGLVIYDEDGNNFTDSSASAFFIKDLSAALSNELSNLNSPTEINCDYAENQPTTVPMVPGIPDNLDILALTTVDVGQFVINVDNAGTLVFLIPKAEFTNLQAGNAPIIHFYLAQNITGPSPLAMGYYTDDGTVPMENVISYQNMPRLTNVGPTNTSVFDNSSTIAWTGINVTNGFVSLSIRGFNAATGLDARVNCTAPPNVAAISLAGWGIPDTFLAPGVEVSLTAIAVENRGSNAYITIRNFNVSLGQP